MKQWQLQDAKNRFSQVVREAATSGPQLVTARGREAAVVLSAEDYRRLSQRGSSLVDFFKSSPLSGADLDFSRPEEASDVIDL